VYSSSFFVKGIMMIPYSVLCPVSMFTLERTATDNFESHFTNRSMCLL
jgi:hypothetical protein